jgi:hypothetical protein
MQLDPAVMLPQSVSKLLIGCDIFEMKRPNERYAG